MDSLPRILGVSHKSKYPKILSYTLVQVSWTAGRKMVLGYLHKAYQTSEQPENGRRCFKSSIVSHVSSVNIFYVDVGNLF